MPSSPTDPAFWQGRATEARTAAAEMSDPLSCTAMLALAARYERLANRIARGSDFFATAGIQIEEQIDGRSED
jgi:hypothetical protein